MRNILLWGIMGLLGFGLIFNGSIRNDYYTAFSYLFPNNSKNLQDLADTTRIALGLVMSLSLLNIFTGLLFKILSLIGFVMYSVITNQQFILSPSLKQTQNIYSIIIHVVFTFLFMDSIITQIVYSETKPSKQKTEKIIQKIKAQIKQTQPQKPQINKNKNQSAKQKVRSQKQIKTEQNSKSKKNN